MFKVEKAKDLLSEIAPLLIANWLEVEDNQDTIPLKPDFKQYLLLEDIGKLMCISVRDEERLVGYCIVIISEHINHSLSKFATVATIYISPEHRKGLLAKRLINFVEKEVKKVGAVKISFSSRKEESFAKMLHRSGYGIQEVIHSKYIGD